LTAVAAEEHAARLLVMVSALEEAIIRFEDRAPDETRETVQRLRQLQDEILIAFLRQEGDFRPS
jgi:hypothetical protein